MAFELKAGRFKPEYAGKINFYLNLLDRCPKELEDEIRREMGASDDYNSVK
jgi:hypothetical protein